MVERVLLAEPRGFCAGVEMAIKALTWMVRVFPPPVYCFHEIVHNATVVEVFERAGVVFVDSIDDVPEGAAIMLSAHGSAPEVVAAAASRSAVMVDAVCPLVTKVHHEVRSKAAAGFEIIYVGHEGHDEAVGTVAEAPSAVTLVDPERGLADFAPSDPSRVALVAQTTLGVFEWESVLADARGRFPELWTARRSDLCYATTNRQEAVRELALAADVVLVVGSETSSNTMALVRVAREHGAAAYRVDAPDSIDPAWLESAATVGVTAGASAPDSSVRAVIEAVNPSGGVEILSVSRESEYFPPPPQLRAFLSALQAAVEAGVSARHPGRPGPLDDDRSWGATEALRMLGG
ncbi:MAG: 4-hydroxy-3-methylbut-2-enyl diphosphate reductase [Actinobacteria bacterium RBG_16_68_21]|nr:MAG: 4-hydroxy-3-methylbut-2-enyl diphosphate reductase [Actinobacteria bacterium RBG_16_68_21]